MCIFYLLEVGGTILGKQERREQVLRGTHGTHLKNPRCTHGLKKVGDPSQSAVTLSAVRTRVPML